jgi:hypothetical protein
VRDVSAEGPEHGRRRKFGGREGPPKKRGIHSGEQTSSDIPQITLDAGDLPR